MFILPIERISSLKEIQEVTDKPISQGSSIPFADILKDSMESLAQANQKAEEDSYSIAFGEETNLDMAMINSAILGTSVKTAVQLTSRAVSAYKEIVQMQI